MQEKNKSEYYTDAKGMRWFRSGDIGQAKKTFYREHILYRVPGPRSGDIGQAKKVALKM